MTAPRRAMVLAAGLGLRMRPLTERLPKPLLPVAGRTLLDHALDRLAAAGVEAAVVNTHHLADQVARHLATRAHPRVILSHEPELLETGGGVAKALAELAPGPFYVINSDSFWFDGERGALERLAAAWDERRMAALLLLQEVERANGYAGAGDFHLAPGGRLQRRREGERACFLFTGIQLLSMRLFDGAKVERFSLNRLYDRAIDAGRLYGLVHDGAFFHVGTPEGLALAEQALARPANERSGGGR